MNEIQKAATLLKNNELVAFPTETVYGLGARVFSEEAVTKIFLIKKRSLENPLAVLISNLSQAELLAQDLPKSFFSLSKAFFPGPLTLIVKKNKKVPDLVTAGLDTIGIRMPDHQMALDLIDAVGEPLAATSANPSGEPSPTTADQVIEGVYTLDGGECKLKVASTVVDLVSFEKPKILRQGKISEEHIGDIL